MPYKCLLCGRDKFTKPGQAHHCRVGFAKHFGRIASKRGMECVFVEVGAQQGKPAGLLLAAGEG